MNNQHGSCEQTRQRKTVADLLHCYTSRAQRGGRNIRSAVVVDHDSNSNVGDGDTTLANDKRSGVVTSVAHF